MGRINSTRLSFAPALRLVRAHRRRSSSFAICNTVEDEVEVATFRELGWLVVKPLATLISTAAKARRGNLFIIMVALWFGG